MTTLQLWVHICQVIFQQATIKKESTKLMIKINTKFCILQIHIPAYFLPMERHGEVSFDEVGAGVYTLIIRPLTQMILFSQMRVGDDSDGYLNVYWQVA